MKFKLLFLMFAAINLYSYDTYEYLVYREEHFPQDRYRISVSTINPEYRYFNETGLQNDAYQPFRNNSYYKNYNEKYSVISFTPISDWERDFFIHMESDYSYIKLLKMKFLETKNGVINYKEQIIDNLPEDFNVDVSSQ